MHALQCFYSSFRFKMILNSKTFQGFQFRFIPNISLCYGKMETKPFSCCINHISRNEICLNQTNHITLPYLSRCCNCSVINFERGGINLSFIKLDPVPSKTYIISQNFKLILSYQKHKNWFLTCSACEETAQNALP